jgi:hypothetical protein
MKFQLKIKDITSMTEIAGYWSNADYINLLEELGFPDAKKSNPSELRELVEMAISDFETHESTEILLRYKLKDILTSGQIHNLSHEMAEDNESDENPNIALHYILFNINQLLRSAYNGIFPNAEATKMEIELVFTEDKVVTLTKELAVKSISKGLNNRSPLIRLFENQLNGKEPCSDVEDVIWEIHNTGPNEYTIITSDYWINDEDINDYEYAGSIKEFEAI